MITTIDLMIDRGNLLTKVLYVKGKDAPVLLKFSSLISKVTSSKHSGIKLKGQSGTFVCGNSSLNCQSGEQYIPIDDDKLTNLSAIIAHTIAEVCGDSILKPRVNLIVATPLKGSTFLKRLRKEVSVVAKGFKTTKGVEYYPSFQRLGLMSEGRIFLDCHKEFNGVIDFGSGTLQGFIRDSSGNSVEASAPGGEIGGANSWIIDMLESSGFRDACTVNKLTKVPSPKTVAVFLGDSKWTVKNIDFQKLMRAVGKGPFNRVVNTANTMDGTRRLKGLRRVLEEDEGRKYALVGGGACLLRGILSTEQIDKLRTSKGITLVDNKPDYANVYAMNTIYNQDPTVFPLFESKKKKTSALVK